MSKIQTMKQQKRFRNQTMNVLNHTNCKSNTPTLADRSLHAFKVVKPEVQSSRINRPQTSKLNTRYQFSYYPGYSKDKDKTLDTYDRIQKISSKSLQSRFNSKNNKTRKQNESKTKKNSYSRLYTDMGTVEAARDSQRTVQLNIEKRMQKIENIFSFNYLDYYDRSEGSSIQSPSLLKKFYPLDIQANISQLGHKSNKNRGNKTSSEMIFDLKCKFEQFHDTIEERKCKMVHDEVDCTFTNIFQKLQSSFMVIIECILRESDDRIKSLEYGFEQLIFQQKYELQKQSKKFQKMKQNYIDKIEGLLVRSLYVTDKINIIQEKGIFNFEKAIRIIDGEQQIESKSQTESVSICVKDSKIGWHRRMDESQVSEEESMFEFSQKFRQPRDEFTYILNQSDDKAKFQNKFNSQNSAKGLR